MLRYPIPFLFVVSLCMAADAPKDDFWRHGFKQESLRGPMSLLPHFQTSLGRDGHRFAGHRNNKYRLYDFYKRQAEYHLELEKEAPLLPYPGIEGGRLGHWGTTNNRDSVAYPREKEPELPSLVMRGSNGQLGSHFLRLGEGIFLEFDSNQACMAALDVDAKLTPFLSNFAGKVDRWGMGIQLYGETVMRCLEKPEGRFYLGHHLCGDQVVYEIQSGNKGRSLLTFSAMQLPQATILVRTSQALDGTLPEAEKLVSRITGKELHHRKRTIGSRISIDYFWIGKASKAVDAAIQADKPITPSELLQQKRNVYPDAFSAGIQQNADPAASCTPYEIDDLDVPVGNHYGLPMTVCSIAFDRDGTAYVSTLVGDVWRVKGLAGNKGTSWTRFANGLAMPIGIEVVDGLPVVITQTNLFRLHDLNQDGEADFYERVEKVQLNQGYGQKANKGLRRDAKGNFYYVNNEGLYRIAPDGSTVERIGDASRQPLGIGVRADGLVISDSSEGNLQNGTSTLWEAHHGSNQGSAAKRKRILYLPRGIDNSAASKIFLDEPRFGLLGQGSLVGLSYGTGTWYQILRDENEGTPQAALVKLPGDFAAGARDLAINPVDGQLYVVGFDGWGDFSVKEGVIHRIRSTGKASLRPMSWSAEADGIRVTFNMPVDPASLNAKRTFAQQWNYRDSDNTYGSGEYSVRHPEQLGHDRLKVIGISLEDSGKTVFFKITDLLPAACTQIYTQLRSTNGTPLTLDLYATINRLAGKAFEAPTFPYNGNTSQLLLNHFNKLRGLGEVKRAVAPEVEWNRDQLDFAWVSKNVIQKQCMPCHAPATPHDYSTHEGFLKTIRLDKPVYSPVLGMLKTDSMPPFPLPKVSESAKQALETWIKIGAPKSRLPSTTTFFNGKNLQGWSAGDITYWGVEEGAIVGKSLAFAPIHKNQFIWSDTPVRDFHLVMDVKHQAQRNAGIQFRSRREGEIAIGYQADIGTNVWGRLYHEHDRKMLDWRSRGEKAVKPKDWNRYEILAVGDRIWTAINGQLATAIKDPQGEREGLIALQIHSGPSQTVQYRPISLVHNPPIALAGLKEAELNSAAVDLSKHKAPITDQSHPSITE